MYIEPFSLYIAIQQWTTNVFEETRSDDIHVHHNWGTACRGSRVIVWYIAMPQRPEDTPASGRQHGAYKGATESAGALMC